MDKVAKIKSKLRIKFNKLLAYWSSYNQEWVAVSSPDEVPDKEVLAMGMADRIKLDVLSTGGRIKKSELAKG